MKSQAICLALLPTLFVLRNLWMFHTLSHRCEAEALSSASSTLWLRTPSSKFGDGIVCSPIALSRSSTVCVKVCS